MAGAAVLAQQLAVEHLGRRFFGSTQIVSSHATWAPNDAPAGDAPWIGRQLLTPIVEAARVRWQQAGISPVDAALLDRVHFQSGPLRGNMIAETLGTTVAFSGNAAGRGWFVDSTPLDDEEFIGTGGGMIAAPGYAYVEGQIDLLSVVQALGAAWQNPRDPMDVNDDGMVTPLDAIILINYIIICRTSPSCVSLPARGYRSVSSGRLALRATEPGKSEPFEAKTKKSPAVKDEPGLAWSAMGQRAA